MSNLQQLNENDTYLQGIVDNVNSIMSKSVDDISSILEETKKSVGNEITNLKEYVESQDTATKAYVNEQVSLLSSAMSKEIDTIEGSLSSYVKKDSKIAWSSISGTPQFVTSQLTANDIKGMGFAMRDTSDIGVLGIKVNNVTTTQGIVDLGYLVKEVTWKKDGVTSTWSPSQNSGVLDLGEISSEQHSQPSQVKPTTSEGVENAFEVIEYATNPTTAIIAANKLYKWKSSVSFVNVSIEQPSNVDAAAVYTLRFKIGSSFSGFKIKTPTGKILVPYDIAWNTNTEYEVSILFDKYTYTLKQMPLREVSSANADTPILIS